jgi:branched-chain amino acid transport system permease protein
MVSLPWQAGLAMLADTSAPAHLELGGVALIDGGVLFCVLVALGQAWRMVGVLGGRPSLGHAAFFGVGACGTSLLLARAGVSPWIGLWLAAGVAALVGAGVGLVTARLRAPAFALCTLIVAELLRNAASFGPGPGLAGGAEGLSLRTAPPLELFWLVAVPAERAVPWAALALAVGAIALTRAVAQGRLGLGLAALADDVEAARAVGISPARYHGAALALSAAVAGLAGGLHALHTGSATPGTAFGLATVSLPAALACLLGGGTSAGPAGPILGALILAPLHTALTAPRTLLQLGLLSPGAPALALLERHGGSLVPVLDGLLLVAVVLFLPQGLASLPGRLRRRQEPTAAPAA